MSKSPRIRPQDYSVGWICALPIELAAAQEMLDIIHADAYQIGNDTPIYTVGSMSGHNVVVACLPEGQTGTSPATAVAIQMKSAFPSIRFGLMVGVGGGVPTTEHDIRLGDVVVSSPDKGHGGVAEYDFGKSTQGGFLRTGFLNAPPQILLNAVSKLRSKHLRKESKVFEHASKSRFTQKVPGPDILFRSDYSHVGGDMCEECDKDRIVGRTPRDTQEVIVHYGTIASGNRLIKDAVERDRLSSKLGGVLCFDMEAAGLMNNFPCLIVRGISDYADSHKNKKWQPYAAVMAAAYAKDLLSVIPTAEVTKSLTTNESLTADKMLENALYRLSISDDAPCDNNTAVPAYFGWSPRDLALGLRIVSDVQQTLSEAKNAAVDVAETKQFLRELESTLKYIEQYKIDIPSGKYTGYMANLLEGIKAPFEQLMHFVTQYTSSYRADSQESKASSTLGLNLCPQHWDELFGKTMELKEAIGIPLKLVYILVLLQNLEDIEKLTRRSLESPPNNSTASPAKVIRALREAEVAKPLTSLIQSLDTMENHERVIQSEMSSPKQDIPSTQSAQEETNKQALSKWEPTLTVSLGKSDKMIIAIERLRQELHRSTGVIIDLLFDLKERHSNERDIESTLEQHHGLLKKLHESLKSSWTAVDEIENELKDLDVQDKMQKQQSTSLRNWFSSFSLGAVGGVVGTTVTEFFITRRQNTNEQKVQDSSPPSQKTSRTDQKTSHSSRKTSLSGQKSSSSDLKASPDRQTSPPGHERQANRHSQKDKRMDERSQIMDLDDIISDSDTIDGWEDTYTPSTMKKSSLQCKEPTRTSIQPPPPQAANQNDYSTRLSFTIPIETVAPLFMLGSFGSGGSYTITGTTNTKTCHTTIWICCHCETDIPSDFEMEKCVKCAHFKCPRCVELCI